MVMLYQKLISIYPMFSKQIISNIPLQFFGPEIAPYAKPLGEETPFFMQHMFALLPSL